PLLVSNSLNIESLERLDNNKSLPSKTYSKRPGHKHKITQSSDKEEAIEDVEVVRILPAKHPGRKRVEDVKTIRIPPAKRPGHKTKAAQPPDDEKGVEDAETIRIPPAKCPRRKCKA
ncbi:6820_t:CDS:2, partial [Rhizophagus irregularis]